MSGLVSKIHHDFTDKSKGIQALLQQQEPSTQFLETQTFDHQDVLVFFINVAIPKVFARFHLVSQSNFSKKKNPECLD